MKHYTKLPAISGKDLIDLLLKDGWVCHGTFKTGHLGTFQKRPLLVGN